MKVARFNQSVWGIINDAGDWLYPTKHAVMPYLFLEKEQAEAFLTDLREEDLL